MKKLIKKISNNEIAERVKSPTPPFFKRVRKIGIIIAGIGTLITTLPVSLPVTLTAWGGYLITAGGVMAATAQSTKE